MTDERVPGGAIRIDLTDAEAFAVVESLVWSVRNIYASDHHDDGKPARVAAALAIKTSVAQKIHAARKARQ